MVCSRAELHEFSFADISVTVPRASHILKKFRGRPPSLIIHLHPTHFRFDQQEGSFAYNSEMRIFIEHLHKGTIPHDMIEEFRKTEVQFYDGWIIVRVIDHRNTNNSAGLSNGPEDDGKVFSIHNYNPYITPSPYAPYPTKERIGQRSPRVKHENKDSNSSQSKEGQNGDVRSDDTVEAALRTNKPHSKVYHVALRPTTLSRHTDLVIDAMAPDPKSLNRKQSQANVARTPGAGAPPTPVSGVPSTPATDKGPPPKRQKMKIDAKDLLDYEARTVNATAPPIYLDAVGSLDEAEAIITMLRDPYHNEPPPSLKSRKRTVAELAAEDAHAKEQERFMLVMDERNAGTSTGANAGSIDAQAGAALFQPRFEKFNALETIKRDIAERKQREKDRQLQEDENRRQMQERAAEDTERRRLMERQRNIKMQQQMRQQQEMQAAMQQQQQNQQQPQGMQQQRQGQASGIPPQMQNQMMAAQQQRSSPIIRQGTPHAASSPMVNGQGGQAMTVSSSQQGAGSPARPGSAVQHGHPMARGPSGQGPSRNGTPQIPHSTPGMRTSTPVVRQGTPAQHMTQASPHGSMMAPTPQLAQAAAMQNRMPNGMHPQMTQQQMAEFQRRQQMQQQVQLRQQQMANGTTPQMGQAQMAHMQAQQHAQQATMHRAQQQQQAQQQAMQQQQQGTPQSVAQSPANNHASYNKGVAESMKAQMQALQQGQTQGSPAPSNMTPANQSAQLAHQHQQRMMQQAQQQNQMMGMQNPQQPPQQGQPQRGMTPQMQQMFNAQVSGWTQRLMSQYAGKYGGNTAMLNAQEVQQIQAQARGHAMNEMRKRQMAQQAQLRQQQGQTQAAQQGGGGNPGGAGNGAMPNSMNMAQMTPNMQQALQQQQAHQMQQMQMQQAQQMMQHQQQQNGMAGTSQNGMASMQQYQHQLQQMAAQQQAQQHRQG